MPIWGNLNEYQSTGNKHFIVKTFYQVNGYIFEKNQNWRNHMVLLRSLIKLYIPANH